MNVKFDLVRFGQIRKKSISETILKQNVNLLKANIRYFLEEENCSHKDNTIHMTLIIPGKGYQIRMVLQDLNDSHIRKALREKFTNYIYNGKKSAIIDNISNKVF